MWQCVYCIILQLIVLYNCVCWFSINLRIKKGSLVSIVGIVGSGKSSILSAILGEMEADCGRVILQVGKGFVEWMMIDLTENLGSGVCCLCQSSSMDPKCNSPGQCPFWQRIKPGVV